MPSQRRMRVFSLLIVLAIIVTLYMSGSSRQTRSSDFYTKTQQELQAREFEKAAKLRDEQDVTSRLKAAEAAAKEKANLKDQRFKDSVEGDKTVAGRVKLREQAGDKKQVPGVAGLGGKSRDREAAKEDDETQEEHEVETELNDILKKSPIIIFSKSYCPHSRDAKRILLEKYNIVPTPYVVELDKHPMGVQLQAVLGETTGRRTVPNVLVIGKSIGGGDDMVELHRTDKLIDTLRSMGGARIVEASHREGAGAHLDMRRRRV